MVKLLAGPTSDIVQAYKRKVDFYVVRGQHRARAWPKWTITKRSSRVVAQQPWLSTANDLYNSLKPFTAWGLGQLARTGTHTGRDIFMKHYFGTCFRPCPYAIAPCPHETPSPHPDPRGHYQFPSGIRLREEASGSRFIDILYHPNHQPRLHSYMWLYPSTIVPAFHDLTYTRRGITYTGYRQPVNSIRNFSWSGEWDPAGFWYFDLTWLYENFPFNHIFFNIHPYISIPGVPGLDSRMSNSPMYHLSNQDWIEQPAKPAYSKPPHYHAPFATGWNNFNSSWWGGDDRFW